MKKLPSVAYLHECFYLDGGTLYWKLRPKEHFPTDRGWATFNGKNAGKKAGRIGSTGHVVLTLDSKKRLASRIIFKMYFRVESTDLYIVHKDGDRTNNHPSNLCLETKDTAVACHIKHKRTRGVHWCHNRQKWVARVGGARPKWEGVFDDIEDACDMASIMRERFYGTHHGVR